MVYEKFDSPIGKIIIIADNSGIKELRFGTKDSITNKLERTQDNFTKALQICKQAKEELKKYFERNLKQFTVQLSPEGTEFQKTVWKELCKIPYGKTLSYKQIAVNINNPKSYRAVGNANGKNPIPIIIPCHRVICTGGKLGGFSAGLDRKRFLLNLEQKECQIELIPLVDNL
ncbi:methylated-DNA--[protein]-cysteine S-methyltransferase [Treponema putidum]|uniref:Methylated-DNA--protein-cysteine methyltransferase n=1 Tax=Treponema putidum TaxID=221027 RepID=A0AAE9SK66_9SPIR|nr:methylated-DNA--[protein]-cysteine S-methyltransferase [Treponema putidum]AIN93469.1 cysteine methyltransferase [Treponema putidum]TWI72346.1 methylated-DNA-[protein]-cysteine S-methyltransferase [Treponema putidum]UTY29715.1 methylated-DNA--[protein]-cysteine S-methyltransferase [Treponema putidum]UTY32182.1 methylated-DNA--[protein]-cysteine S-methyltransferase [Treponema putidum]UTY34576.1 methylated-DNA--[protein]-cysteine S-methyltransferase [Treponema putidum]